MPLLNRTGQLSFVTYQALLHLVSDKLLAIGNALFLDSQSTLFLRFLCFRESKFIILEVFRLHVTSEMLT